MVFGRLLVLTSSVVVMLVQSAAAADEPGIAELDQRVRQLKQERVELLQDALKATLQQFAQGAIGQDSVFELRFELLDARLELADSAVEELSLWRESCKLAEDHVEMLKGHFRAGRCSRVDLHLAQAHSLKMQIECAKTQRKILVKKKP